MLPVIKEKLQARFKGLDPVRLLQEIRHAQKTLSELAAHSEFASRWGRCERMLRYSLPPTARQAAVLEPQRKEPTADTP